MVFYFYGENKYAIKEQIRAIKKKYLDKNVHDFNLVTLDLSEVNLTDLVTALSAQPLLATSRLIIAKNLAQNKTALANINDLLKLVADTTILVIEDSEVDRRSGYFKKLSKLERAREFKHLPPAQLQNWVKKEVTKLSGSIDAPTVLKLIQLVGNDQWQLKNEIEKLVSFSPSVTNESIEQLVVPNIEQTIFELVDSVARGNLKKALEVYGHLTTRGTNDQQILAMLVWQYRNVILAYDNLGGDQKWIKDFGISPFAATKAMNLASEIAFDVLTRAYQMIIKTDYAIKSGQKDSQVALEQLLHYLT